MISSALHSINTRSGLIELNKPIVMGIVNLSPDSFYSNSIANSDANLLKKVEKHIIEGAVILDLGAMSSRPGSKFIEESLEITHFVNAISSILKEFPDTIISVDTHRSKSAKVCLDEGAMIINDISGGDDEMIDLIAKEQVPYILMHMLGTPLNMQNEPEYDNLIVDVLDYLMQKLGKLRARGIHDVIIDPGFGFGKTIADNYRILDQLNSFRVLDCPILAGISRKSMIYKALDILPEEALNATTALHMMALNNHASILRVHDVKEAIEVVKLFELIKK